MTIKLAHLEIEAPTTTSSQSNLPTFDASPHAARLSWREASPNVDSEEYRVLYLPTMVGVYTARHQLMPPSDESLRQHVFGNADHAGCEACREETEFLVAHQKKFF